MPFGHSFALPGSGGRRAAQEAVAFATSCTQSLGLHYPPTHRNEKHQACIPRHVLYIYACMNMCFDIYIYIYMHA